MAFELALLQNVTRVITIISIIADDPRLTRPS